MITKKVLLTGIHDQTRQGMDYKIQDEATQFAFENCFVHDIRHPSIFIYPHGACNRSETDWHLCFISEKLLIILFEQHKRRIIEVAPVQHQ